MAICKNCVNEIWNSAHYDNRENIGRLRIHGRSGSGSSAPGSERCSVCSVQLPLATRRSSIGVDCAECSENGGEGLPKTAIDCNRLQLLRRSDGMNSVYWSECRRPRERSRDAGADRRTHQTRTGWDLTSGSDGARRATKVHGLHANSFVTTFPPTSVKRKSRPWKRKVSLVWSSPSRWRNVACRSCT